MPEFPHLAIYCLKCSIDFYYTSHPTPSTNADNQNLNNPQADNDDGASV
jgi:hypothetical protein